ncbi:Uncharacterised protein [Mycobacterium tuberculosis]|nr:Uncharacterised protein [Mycobacterium tuberculosis]
MPKIRFAATSTANVGGSNPVASAMVMKTKTKPTTESRPI